MANNIYLKKVESTVQFQKIKKILGEVLTNGEDLRFTYCDVNDTTVRPFSNLFSSFKLPVNSIQRTALNTYTFGTGLSLLPETKKIVVVEIPKDHYAEMIDGKSIELTFPIKTTEGIIGNSITCYSTYYNFNSDLNSQVSDQNSISSIFGVEGTVENEFNTNIAYLFSNEIARPVGMLQEAIFYQNNNIIIDKGTNFSYTFPSGQKLLANNSYSTDLINLPSPFLVEFLTGAGYLPLQSVSKINFSNVFNPIVDILGFKIFNTGDYPLSTTVQIKKNETVLVNDKFWDKWTTNNKFPTTKLGTGKAYAQLQDTDKGVLIDYPVGIAYLDKGLIVLTDERLVDNIDETLMSLNQDSSGNTIPETEFQGTHDTFSSTYFTDTNKAYLKTKSVMTEFTQSYTCLALQNEFYKSDNPTYNFAYSGTPNENPNVYITELGLYNAVGELIAIGKPSRPVAKNRSNVSLFKVILKI